MRSNQLLSKRIFWAFAVLTAAFALVMGFTVLRMDRAREQMELLSGRYMRLALLLSEIHITQANLLNTISARDSEKHPADYLNRQIRLALQYRQQDIRRAQKLAADVVKTGVAPSTESSANTHFMSQVEAQLTRILRSAQDNDRHYQDSGLLRGELQLSNNIRRLRDDVRAHLRSASEQMADDQHYSVVAGLIFLAVVLTFGAVISLRVRKMLQPLTVLLDGTKKIGRGDYRARIDVASPDELGQLARAFNQMADSLEEREHRLIHSERLATAGRLAAQMTHEVRNPLNAISLNSELLEDAIASSDARTAPEAVRLCKAIRHGVNHLTAVTEQYLSLARSPHAKTQEESINGLIADLTSFFAQELTAARIKLSVSLDQTDPRVLGNEDQLRQLFTNLIRNAMEAIGEQSGEISIRTAVQSSDEPNAGGQTVLIEVGDNGRGIAVEDLPHVFDPFFTTKPKGTGIGLSVTHQIVVAHGGQLTATSNQSARQTVFSVVLPLYVGNDKISLEVVGHRERTAGAGLHGE